MQHATRVGVAIFAVLVAGGCGGVDRDVQATTSAATAEKTPRASSHPSISPPEPTNDPPALALDGRRVALDPGHNGGNKTAASTINSKISDGRGGTKACNTTGTSTNSGFAEHAFSWDVALRTKAVLEAQGAEVFLTRDSDTGIGPCVDRRGAFAEKVNAELLISIHGDGSTNPNNHGFFAIVSEPALNDAQGEPALRLADVLIDSLAENGFTPNSSYQGGLSKRADIAGLNWATRPAVLLELGEMRNAEDAAVMESEDGRQRYAESIVGGIQRWFDAN